MQKTTSIHSLRGFFRHRGIYVTGCLLALPALWGLSRGGRDLGEPIDISATPGRATFVERAGTARIEAERDVPADDADGPDAEGQVVLASFEAVAEDDSDVNVRHTRQVVGVWQDEYQGKRELTVRADGTATMVVYPSGIGRKLFADRLQFEIDWTLSDGRIVMITTSGEPEKQTRLVLKLYGNRAEYTLENLDDRQLLLVDADGKTKYDWRRIEPKE